MVQDSVDIFKDRWKAIPQIGAWMQLCILYICIYTPDLFYKL